LAPAIFGDIKDNFLELYAILSSKINKMHKIPPEVVGANIQSDCTEAMCPRIQVHTLEF